MTKKTKIPVWSVLVWLVFWQAASMLLNQQIILVSPVRVIIRLTELIRENDFWRTILSSFSRIGAGFLLGALLGLLLAIIASRYKRVNELLRPLVLTIKTIPVASFIILVLTFAPSRHLAIIISFLMVLPVIYTNVLEGIENIDTGLLEMAQVYKLSGSKRLLYITMPQVYPYYRAACRTALGFAWKSGIAAEVIGMPTGSIGERLQQAKIYLDTPDLFAWTLVIVLLSIACEKLWLILMDKVVEGMEKR